MAPFGASRAGLMSGQRDAIPDSVVDNFELHPDADGAESPYGIYGEGETIEDYYRGGQLDDYSITESDVIDGERALSYDENTGDDQLIYSLPGDGLNRYPEPEDTVSYLSYGDGDLADVGTWDLLTTNVEESGDRINGYGFGIDYTDEIIGIYRWDGKEGAGSGNRALLDSTSISVSDNTWYWVVIDTPDSDGDMSATVYEVDTESFEKGSEVGSVSTTDTTHSHENRGIGMVGRRRGTSDMPNYDRIIVGEPSGY